MSSSGAIEALLRDGLCHLGLEPPAEAIGRLLQYMELLRRWGRVYNLTAIDRPEDVVRLHLLDSLSSWTHVRGPRILDVGTGAGLPGIPLAIVLPDHQIHLLDRSAKKVRFVTQTAIELGLGNAHPVQSRVEDYSPDQPFDTILVRAYGSLVEIWQQTRRLLNEHGQILAMKGRLSEICGEVAEGMRAKVFPLQVPGLEAERHLVEMTPDP